MVIVAKKNCLGNKDVEEVIYIEDNLDLTGLEEQPKGHIYSPHKCDHG